MIDLIAVEHRVHTDSFGYDGLRDVLVQCKQSRGMPRD